MWPEEKQVSRVGRTRCRRRRAVVFAAPELDRGEGGWIASLAELAQFFVAYLAVVALAVRDAFGCDTDSEPRLLQF